METIRKLFLISLLALLEESTGRPLIFYSANTPRAGFKLPPQEAYRLSRTDLVNLPVYSNRVPLITTYPLTFPAVIRAHTTPTFQPNSGYEVRTPVDRPSFSQRVVQTPVHNPVIHQFRSQDEHGGYHFSYSGGPSSRSETRDHNGAVRGSYSYVDPTGRLRKYNYVADAGGFRVTEEEDANSRTRKPRLLVAAGTTAFRYLPLPSRE